MLNVGCQPNDRVISHWQDASNTGTLRSACATDSLSMQNHLPDYSELHILRQWDHSFSHNNQFIRLTLVALAKLAWVCEPSREQYERQNTPPSLPLTRRHYWTKNWWHPLSVTISIIIVRLFRIDTSHNTWTVCWYWSEEFIISVVLIHLPLVPHICVREWGQHWFR